ncbi:MAG: hypothetical protein HC875_01370 [Anaerolineales bacterium]|nr:hypothetical protein [Anaerolineales bacterium]
MDPVSIIATALINGIMAGLERTTAQIVSDSYIKLKDLILRKYSTVRPSLEQLEKAPHSKARRDVIEEDLRHVGADQDEEVLALAQGLMRIVEYASVDIPGNDFEQTRHPEELIEKAERQAGNQAISQVVDKHLAQVMGIRSQYPISNFDLLSANIVNVSQIPEKLRIETGRLQNKIRIIIEEVASRIEERKYRSSEQAIESMPLAYVDRIKARELVQADKQIHVSYQALKTTVEFFADLNQMIIDKIEKSPSAASETNLVLGNAILVYELTDFLIGFIEDFRVRGVEEILKLYQETQIKTKEFRHKEEALRRKAEAEEIDAAVREQTLGDIGNRERSIKLLEEEWEDYIKTIKSLQNEVGVVHKKLPTLELIRENAKTQIELIQAVAMLQILKQNIGALEGAILTLEKIKLITLSPTRVRRLLGIR